MTKYASLLRKLHNLKFFGFPQLLFFGAFDQLDSAAVWFFLHSDRPAMIDFYWSFPHIFGNRDIDI